MLDNHYPIQILNAYSNNEHRDFLRFLESPFCNNDQKLIELYKVLKKISRNFKKSIQKEEVLECLNIEADELKRRLGSLQKSIEQYIILTEISKKEHTVFKQILIVKYLFRKKLPTIAKGILNKMNKYLKKKELLNWHTYYDDFLVKEMELHYNLVFDVALRANDSFKATLKSFLRYCTSGLMRFYCSTFNMAMIVNVDHNSTFWKYLKTYFEENEAELVPATSIYYNIHKLQHGEMDPQRYDKLLQLLKEEGHRFSKDELRQMYKFIQNLCIIRYRKGNLAYNDSLFSLYKESLEQDLWYENVQFKSETFIHIVRTALNANSIAWATQFVEGKGKLLQETSIADTTSLANAYICHAEKRFEQANDFLFKITDQNNPSFKYHIKVLKIMISYDKTKPLAKERQVNSVLAIIEQLRSPLVKKGIKKLANEKILKSFLNFAKLAKRLHNAKYQTLDPNCTTLKNIERDILEGEMVVERPWLLLKIQELLEKNKC